MAFAKSATMLLQYALSYTLSAWVRMALGLTASDHLQQLRDFVIANDGIVSEKAEVAAHPSGGRGLFASADIKKGEIIFSVPVKLILSQSRVAATHALPREIMKISDFSLSQTALSAFIVRELERMSVDAGSDDSENFSSYVEFFRPLLQALDLDRVADMPYFRSRNEDMRILKGSPEYHDLIQSDYWYARDHSKIVSNFHRSCPPDSSTWCAADIGAFNRTKFILATLFVSSRSFAVGDQHYLVPWADFLNHAPEGMETATWKFDDDRDAIVVKAIDDISRGSELSISYGERSNPQLFCAYGFTVPPALERSFSFRLWVNHFENFYTDLSIESFLEAGGDVDLVLKTPPRMVERVDNFQIHALIKLLKLLSSHGMEVVAALGRVKLLVTSYLNEYEQDEVIEPYRKQLALNRKHLSSSLVWWSPHFANDVSIDTSALEVLGQWRSQVVRVKMSEYLCLLAHWEMFRLWSGAVNATVTLRESVLLLDAMKKHSGIETLEEAT